MSFGKKFKICVLGLLVSLTLSGTDAVYGNRKVFFSEDHLFHAKIAASAYSAIKQGQFPPRVAVGLFNDGEYPLHQFYSPAVHTIMAFFIFLLNGNLFYGISLSNVLMMTLAFIFSFKLCKYLTQSTIWGYVGAFLFVCGPYLSANRVLRGAFAEYYAMCTLPMVIYYQLRAMANPRIKNWILASSSLSLLLHMHLITWAYTLFFEVIFWFSHTVFMVFDGSPDKKTILGKYRKRTAAFVSPILGCVILSAWYLAPIIFFNKNLMIQASLNPTVQHNFMTTILSVLSIRDMRFVTSLFQNRGRYQLGFLLFAGFVAFLSAGRGKISSLGLPLRITSLVILLFIIMPINLFPGRLKIIDIAQFPYRFIAQFQLIATMMSVMALKYFLSSWKDITIIHKKIIGLVVIVFSLTLVTPYLYPDISQSSPDSFPFMFTDEQIYNVDRMSYDAADYLRIPPAGVPEQDEPAVFARQTSGTPNDKTFSVDLKNYGGPEYMIFDVLYYPGLQRIAATLDGQVFHPEISTHWYKDGGGFNIHAMKVSGLPAAGILSLNVRFTGYRAGNVMSLAGICVIFLLGIFSAVRRHKVDLRFKRAF